jgi:polyisoprenoid-binding protein YceI
LAGRENVNHNSLEYQEISIMIKKLLMTVAFLGAFAGVNAQAAEKYVIDTKGMHAFVTFRVKHLGYSWLQGRFNNFSGDFTYDDANPSNNKVKVDIDVTSLDSNHAERDKHLKDPRFFDAAKYPDAKFVSTGWKELGNGKAKMSGKFTLRGVTKDIELDVTHTGGGKDPWGGFRRGFEATTTLQLADYKMKEGAMLHINDVEIWISVEGIRE